MKRTNKIFLVPMFLFLIVFIVPTLLAEQDCTGKPSPKLLNVSQTTIGNPQSEFLNPKSVNSNPSNPKSAIQNLSSTTIGEQQLDKAEFARKTKKLQIPFIANNGQVDEQVRFYAKTFGGTVFVTKDGEIVYALPHTAADASTLSHYDIDKNETGYTGLTGFLRKEGQCIVHRALCTMYP